METDYLIIGAGASGMAVADEIIEHSSADVVLVDRRADPGGHWVDAYPFVRLHQPSAFYGVGSTPLGDDRVQTEGPEAGWYERASGADIVAYYADVLDHRLVPSGRVRFLGRHDYLRPLDGTGDDHEIRSVADGATTTISVRRAVVDATALESSIPLRHDRPFDVADGVDVRPPNELEGDGVAELGDHVVIVGGGKTSMDVCVWLIDRGVDPEAITWIRPRESWLVDRGSTQPFELSVGMLEHQSRLVEAAARVESADELACSMEHLGLMHRIDPTGSATVFRGATISRHELASLRRVEGVIRGVRVRAVHHARLEVTAVDGADAADVAIPRGATVVDCTAAGLGTPDPSPIFAPGRIRVQMTTTGVVPWSAAMIGYVATLDLPLDEKNRVCPALPRTGTIDALLRSVSTGVELDARRRANPELAAWNAATRLNPGRSIPEFVATPAGQEAFERLVRHVDDACRNAARLVGETASL